MRRISRRNNGPDEEWILLNYSYIIRHLLQSSRNSWSLLANVKDNSSNYKNFFIKSRISSKTLRILNFLEEILGGTRFEVFRWWRVACWPFLKKWAASKLVNSLSVVTFNGQTQWIFSATKNTPLKYSKTILFKPEDDHKISYARHAPIYKEIQNTRVRACACTGVCARLPFRGGLMSVPHTITVNNISHVN